VNFLDRAWEWLTKMELVEPAPDDVVELSSRRTFQEAHELTELLKHEGLRAETFGNRTYENTTGFGALAAATNSFGVRVMVVGADLAAAQAVLADFEEELQQRRLQE
jgi:hypothetical protein